MIKAIEARIAWTPDTDGFANWRTRGNVIVVRYALEHGLGTRERYYPGYLPTQWTPPYAKFVDLCAATNDQDAVFRMLSTMLTVVAEDKVDPNRADLAFRVINEYRMMAGNEFGDWSTDHLIRVLQRRTKQAA